MTTSKSMALSDLDRTGETTNKRRNAIKGAFFSEFIDMFDIYLPVVVLAPVMFLFQPGNLSPAAEVIFSSVVFITTLLGRPVGALIFGVISDRIGRRNASVYSVAGFGIVTLLIGLMPTYSQIGISSYVLLVLLRFVDGIFLGGGYTGAIPLAFECAKKQQRGLVGGLIMAGFPAAYVSINLVAMATFAIFPLNGATSAYAMWGWRIPFVIGALLAGVLALYYVFKVEESEIWKNGTRKAHVPEVTVAAITPNTRVPLTDLLRGKSGANLIQVLTMMTGFWLTQNLITLFMPGGVLVRAQHLSGFKMSLTLLIAYVVLVFSYIGFGMLSQRLGRRKLFLILSPLIATIGSGLLFVLTNVHGLAFPTVVALVCALSLLATSPWGFIITYANERFVTDVRATGFGVGFSLSVIIPSFYAFYMGWLDHVIPVNAAPSVLLAIGGCVAFIGAYLGPETNDVDF